MARACVVAAALSIAAAGQALAAEPFFIRDAINQAVKTNPGVAEAAANRRATDAELQQTRATLLPQVRLQATAGPEKLNREITPEPAGNNTWKRAYEGSVVVRQLLFDGFASLNQIWRQAARVDAAAFRTLERTELIALDAAEAYIDVVRYTQLVQLARDNLRNHRRIFGNVQARFKGGRAGEGDLQQAQERVSSAEAALHEFEHSLEDARAKYRKVVGLEPFNLRFPGRLIGLPPTRDEVFAVAIQFNPTLRAAAADTTAARHAFHATTGEFLPRVSLEGTLTRGADSITYDGIYNIASGKVVLSWDIFRGGQDSWKRVEMGERMIEQSVRQARLQRDAFESVDKAWAARTVTTQRVAALMRDVSAARRVIAAYTKEYELGQRTLVDLLNAENQYFNASVSLVSARGVTVFADYQLLAVMGKLLDYLKTGHPVEAAPLPPALAGIFPTKLPPILINEPQAGPEPLKVEAAPVAVETIAAATVSAEQPPQVAVNQRWLPGHEPTWNQIASRWLTESPTRRPAIAHDTANTRVASDTTNLWSDFRALSFARHTIDLASWLAHPTSAR